MRALLVFLSVALSVTGCSSEGEKAEKRYRMVKRHGTLAELCVAGRELRDAYLRAGDERKYEYWQAFTSGDCGRAEFYGGHLPADSDDRRAVEDAATAMIEEAMGVEGE